MAITFPTATISPAMQIMGAALLYYCPYTAAGADPSTPVFAGILTAKDGIKLNDKRTYVGTEVQQLTNQLQHFLKSEDWTIKATLAHFDPAVMNVALDKTAASYTAGATPGLANTQLLSEPFDTTSPSSVPNMRPIYRTWLIQFPSPSYDNTTSPIGKWGYYHFYKGFISVTGEWHHSRDSVTEVPITLQLDADVSVASGNTVGKIITYKAV